MIEFQVNLILTDENQTDEQLKELKANCTFVKNDLWIFEGEPEFLDAYFTILDSGIVGSLGGLSEKELVDICKETFYFDQELLG